MPRTCTVCAHPLRAEIDKALVNNDSFRDIARRFSISRSALARHKATHLLSSLVQAKEVQDIADADTTLAELRRVYARINLLFDACDAWLRDPDDSTRYTIDPRAEDVQIIYTDSSTGRKVRHKARLSTLLDQVNNLNKFDFIMVEIRHSDPRDLILKASGELRGHLELIARLLGKLQEAIVITFLAAPEWQEVKGSILDALRAHPEAQRDVVRRLEETYGERR